MKKIILSALLAFHLPAVLFAQSSGNTDSARMQCKPCNRPIPVAWLAVPVAMTGYGIFSLHSEGLQKINRNVQQTIWTKNPHDRVKMDNYLQFSPAVAVFALDIAGVKAAHALKDRLFLYGITEVVLTGIVQGGKRLSAEWRPDSSGANSFPSGHTATAFAAAEFLRKEYGQRSPLYAIAGYAAAAATGYLRMYNNKHWLGDVIAGAGIGILTTDFSYFIYPRLQKLFKGKAKAGAMIMPTWQNGQAGFALLRYF